MHSGFSSVPFFIPFPPFPAKLTRGPPTFNISPVPNFIPVYLGTDSRASSPDLDVRAEAEFAQCLHA